jgi:hypothetical protein
VVFANRLIAIARRLWPEAGPGNDWNAWFFLPVCLKMMSIGYWSLTGPETRDDFSGWLSLALARATPCAIGGLAAFWTIERTISSFSV